MGLTAKERINEVEDRSEEVNQTVTEKQRNKIWKRLKEMRNRVMKSNISDKTFINKRLEAIFEDLMTKNSLERPQSPDSRTSQDKLKRKTS